MRTIQCRLFSLAAPRRDAALESGSVPLQCRNSVAARHRRPVALRWSLLRHLFRFFRSSDSGVCSRLCREPGSHFAARGDFRDLRALLWTPFLGGFSATVFATATEHLFSYPLDVDAGIGDRSKPGTPPGSVKSHLIFRQPDEVADFRVADPCPAERRRVSSAGTPGAGTRECRFPPRSIRSTATSKIEFRLVRFLPRRRFAPRPAPLSPRLFRLRVLGRRSGSRCGVQSLPPQRCLRRDQRERKFFVLAHLRRSFSNGARRASASGSASFALALEEYPLDVVLGH